MQAPSQNNTAEPQACGCTSKQHCLLAGGCGVAALVFFLIAVVLLGVAGSQEGSSSRKEQDLNGAAFFMILLLIICILVSCGGCICMCCARQQGQQGLPGQQQPQYASIEMPVAAPVFPAVAIGVPPPQQPPPQQVLQQPPPMAQAAVGAQPGAPAGGPPQQALPVAQAFPMAQPPMAQPRGAPAGTPPQQALPMAQPAPPGMPPPPQPTSQAGPSEKVPQQPPPGYPPGGMLPQHPPPGYPGGMPPQQAPPAYPGMQPPIAAPMVAGPVTLHSEVAAAAPAVVDLGPRIEAFLTALPSESDKRGAVDKWCAADPVAVTSMTAEQFGRLFEALGFEFAVVEIAGKLSPLLQPTCLHARAALDHVGVGSMKAEVLGKMAPHIRDRANKAAVQELLDNSGLAGYEKDSTARVLGL